MRAGVLDPASLDEDGFADFLSTTGIPDPDLIIRTSGEQRLSNFLLWQSAYAELVFQDVLWPDFGPDAFAEALGGVRPRERRFAHALAEPAPRSRKWADLRLRALSAAVLAPLALLCIWVGGWLWVALVLLGGFGLAQEWLTLCRGRSPAWKLAGILYVLPACAALVWLRADPAQGRADVFFLLLVVWATDIGAYVVGRFVGGPKLAPSISPGKTRSGAVGGLAWAALVGVGAAAWAASPVLEAALVAVVLSAVSQVGDLLESAMKRHFGVKDSGKSIPGHGGLFDRLDGVLTAAPVAAAFVLARGGAIWH